MSMMLDFWLFGHRWTDVDLLGPIILALGVLFIRQLVTGFTEANAEAADHADL